MFGKIFSGGEIISLIEFNPEFFQDFLIKIQDQYEQEFYFLFAVLISPISVSNFIKRANEIQ